MDEDFNVYVSDSGNHQIRKIDRDGHVTSFAGSGVSGNSDGSDNTSRFQDPRGITQDYYGNLYVADFGNSEVKLIQVIPDQLSFTIEIEDEAGNFVFVDQTSDNSNITIDLEAPEILSSVLLSDNPNTVGQLSQLAKENDNISLTVVSSEALQSMTLSNVSGTQLPTNLQSNDNLTWSATHTVVQGDNGSLGYRIDFVDLAGNSGSSLDNFTSDNSSIVIDTTAPLLNNISLVTSNDNDSLAKYGDNLTLTFSGDETLQTPVVVIAGETIPSSRLTNLSGSTWQAVYEVQSVDNSTGNYSISFLDLAGNQGNQVSGPTYPITIDTEAPFLEMVSIYSDNLDNQTARLNDLVTLKFRSSESIQRPEVFLHGDNVSVVTTDGVNWRADYSVTGSSYQGQASLDIYFEDHAGNAGTRINETTDNSSVEIDTVIPQISHVSITSTNTNPNWAKYGDNVTVTFQTSEAVLEIYDNISVSGLSGITTTGNDNKTQWSVNGPVESNASGNVTFSLSMQDAAGNQSPLITIADNGSVEIDTQKPSLDNITLVSSNHHDASFAKDGDNLTLRFNVLGSEVIQTPTVLVEGLERPATESGGYWEAVYSVGPNDNGSADFLIAFKDRAGNLGDNVSGPSSQNQITLDNDDPYLTEVIIESDNDNSSSLARVGDNLTLTFTSNESLQVPFVNLGGSIRQATSVSGSLSDWEVVVGVTDNMTSMQDVSISVSVMDLAGNSIANVTSADNTSVLIDRDVPEIISASVISSNPNSGFAKAGDNLTLSFTTSEVVRNPLEYLNIQGVGPIDLSTSDNGTNWIATAQVLDNAIGTPSLSLEVLDQAGNRGSPYIDNFSHITLDTSSPVLTGLSFVSSNLPDNSSIYAKAQDNLTLSFQFQEPIQTPFVSIAGDNQSLQLTHNSDNTSWVAVYTVQPGDNGSATFRIDYQDLAGNYGTPVDPQSHTSIPGSVVSVMMDTQSPTLSSLNISSNNIYDPSLAKLGDNLTLSFVSDEALMIPTGELAGRLGLNAVDNSSATDWYFTTEVLPATPEDNVSFRFDISDLAGNVVTGFNSTLNNSSVRVDKTPPLVSGITLVSTNDNGSWAKAGDNLTLEFITSEAVSTPSILIAANSRLADNRSLDGKQWETIYEVMQGDNGTVNWDFTVMRILAEGMFRIM